MQCKGKTKNNLQCRRIASPGTEFCYLHSESTDTVPTSQREQLSPDLLNCFTEALYYPFIEIPETWAKTAILYWDRLTSIVPAEYGHYQTSICRELQRERLLQPETVDSLTTPEIEQASMEAIEYINTFEAADVHQNDPRSRQMQGLERRARLHRSKVSTYLIRTLGGHSLYEDSGDWMMVSPGFASYYMTLLASKIAMNRGRALLTDSGPASRLVNRAALYDSPTFGRRPRPAVPSEIAQGILATTILRVFQVDSHTSLVDILRFKDKNIDQLSRFREAVRELTSGLRGFTLPEPLINHIEGIYKDRVKPAIAELEARLRESRLQFWLSGLRMSTLISASPTILGGIMAYAGAGPFALVGGASLSILLERMRYTIDKRIILRESPYSYVISAADKFGYKIH